MMTWITRMSIFDSVADLELAQLAMAQRESEALFNEMVFGEPEEGFNNAPTPLIGMWRGYEAALAAYSTACSITMVGHGITDGARSLYIAKTISELRQSGDPVPFEMPPWIRDIDVLMSHRSNLVRRWPGSYSFPRNPTDMPYLWPIVDDDGGYILKLSKYDQGLVAKGERHLSKKVLERIHQ